MINLAFFLFKNNINNWLLNKQGNKVSVIAPTLILIFFTFLQLNILSKPDESTIQIIGWTLLVAVFLFMIFGLMSNRLPARIEDVLWIYMLPMSMNRIVWTCLCWQLLLRSAFWLGAALIADFIRFATGDDYEYLFLKAFMSLLVISLLEIGLFAASTSRGRLKISLSVGALSCLSLLIVIMSIFYNETKASFSFLSFFLESIKLYAFYIGAFAVGEFHFQSFLFLVMFFIIFTLIIQISTKGLDLKEKLTREADFWSNFSNFNALVASVKGEDQVSYWGNKKWTGILAFAWFEWVVWRKHRATFILQFILGITITIFLSMKHSHLLILYFGVILISQLLGGYFSGLIRHTQSGDLLLLPGSKFKKIILLEIVDLLPSLLMVEIYYVISIIIIPFPLTPIFTTLLFFIMIILISLFRIIVFVDLSRKKLEISIQSYYAKMFIYLLPLVFICSIAIILK